MKVWIGEKNGELGVYLTEFRAQTNSNDVVMIEVPDTDFLSAITFDSGYPYTWMDRPVIVSSKS